jgi:hypothetical protein
MNDQQKEVFTDYKTVNPYLIFSFLSILLFMPAILSKVNVAGDITIQLTAALHKYYNTVKDYNCYSTILSTDWSQDKINYITWWPPAFLFILDFLLLSGLSLGFGIKIMVFFSFIVGGCGFISAFRRMGISKITVLIFAILLSTYPLIRDGLTSVLIMSVDFLGFMFFPWLLFFSICYLENLKSYGYLKRLFYTLALFMCIGSLYWVKNTWFVYGCGLSTFVCINILKYFYNSKKIHIGIGLCAFAALAFSTCVVLLEYINYSKVGYSTLSGGIKAYSGAEWYNDMYGRYYTNSSYGWQLFGSILASPGFLSFGHKFFINGSYVVSNLDWIKSIIDSIDLRLNSIIFSYMIFGILGNLILYFTLVKYKNILPNNYFPLIITIMAITIVLFATNSFLHKTANSLLNFDARYRLLINILVEVALIEIMFRAKLLLNSKSRYFIVLPILLIVFSYPIVEGALSVKTIFQSSSLNSSSFTVNDIKGKDNSIIKLNEDLEKNRIPNRTVLIFYSKHQNISPFGYAEKTIFVTNENTMDKLVESFKSKKVLRLFLLVDNMPEIEQTKFKEWQRFLEAKSSWYNFQTNSSNYKLYYIDTGYNK